MPVYGLTLTVRGWLYCSEQVLNIIYFYFQETNTNIKVYSQCAPRSTERVVSLQGKPRNVSDCIGTIYDLLQTVS